VEDAAAVANVTGRHGALRVVFGISPRATRNYRETPRETPATERDAGYCTNAVATSPTICSDWAEIWPIESCGVWWAG